MLMMMFCLEVRLLGGWRQEGGWGRKQAGRRSSCSQDSAQWGRTAREEIGELIRRTEGSRSPTVW